MTCLRNRFPVLSFGSDLAIACVCESYFSGSLNVYQVHRLLWTSQVSYCADGTKSTYLADFFFIQKTIKILMERE